MRERERARAGKERGAHSGVVFTPPSLAHRLAADPLAQGPVLDPACGDGALLLAALRARPRAPDQSAARGLYGIEIDPRLAALARERLAREARMAPSELRRQVICADALDPRTPWPAGTAILANPPWLSFSGRHASPSGSVQRERFERTGRGKGWPSLHGAFLERIAEHVATQGSRARVLVPLAVCELERYRPLRAALAPRVGLCCAPEELGEDAIPGVIGAAALLTFEARPAGATPDCDGGAPWGPAPTLLAPELERSPRLPPGSFADPGVHTGNSADLLIAEVSGPQRVALRRGRDLAPFRLQRPTLYLRTDLKPGEGRRFRIAELSRYASFPVLLRQTANRPIAALHQEPGAFRNSLLACRAVAGLDPAFVVAVLNSPVAGAWHRSSFRDGRQRTFPQVKVHQLATQPFPIIERSQDPDLHDEIVARVRALTLAGESLESDCAALGERVLASFELSPESRRQVLESSSR